jgi:hypothetical protein
LREASARASTRDERGARGATTPARGDRGAATAVRHRPGRGDLDLGRCLATATAATKSFSHCTPSNRLSSKVTVFNYLNQIKRAFGFPADRCLFLKIGTQKLPKKRMLVLEFLVLAC